MIGQEDTDRWPHETRVLVLDFLADRGVRPVDVSADVVKWVADAAQRVARYRMRALSLEELEKLGVGLFGRATYEAWRGNATIVVSPFTLAQFERSLLIMKGELQSCPLWQCEESDGVQREVPQHLTEEQFEAETADAEALRYEILDSFHRPMFQMLQHEPDGYSLADVIDYVYRVLGERRHPSMDEQIRLFSEAHREPDGRIDRVTVAAQVAAWMMHPSMDTLLRNAAMHREASRRRWEERQRPRRGWVNSPLAR
jgi:hypothetical protein